MMSSWEKRSLMRAKAGTLADPCPHCGFAMVPAARKAGPQTTLDASLDHIIPRAARGSHNPENLRVVCKLCNQSRAVTEHCVGALACVRAVLERRRPTTGEVARCWLAWRLRRDR